MRKKNSSKQKAQRRHDMGVTREYKSVTIRINKTDEQALRTKMRRSGQNDLKPYEFKIGEILEIFPECNVCKKPGNDMITREYGWHCISEPSFYNSDVTPLPEFHWTTLMGFAHKTCAERSMNDFHNAREEYKKALEKYEKRNEAKYDENDQFNIECFEWSCKKKCLVPRGVEKWLCENHSQEYQRPSSPVFQPVDDYYPQSPF